MPSKKSLDVPHSYMSMEETFNKNILNYILTHKEIVKPLLRKECFEDNYNPFAILEKYMANSKNGVIKTTYIQKESRGRFNCVQSLGMQSMVREIRHSIACDIYDDIDVYNAHPLILLHLCKLHDIEHKYLKKYIKNREQYLSELSSDRELAKKTVLSLINGGKKAYIKVENKPDWLKELKEELKKIHKSFSKFDGFKAHKKKREQEEIDYNHEASWMNVLLCDFENKILQAIYNKLGKPKDCVLCFDGLMIKKGTNYNLEELEKEVLDILNIKIELKVKPMAEGFKFENVEEYIELKNNCFNFDDKYNFDDFRNEYVGKQYGTIQDIIDNIGIKYKSVIAHILHSSGCYIKKEGDGIVDAVNLLKSSDIQFTYGKNKKIKLSSIIDMLPNSFRKIECVLDDSCPENDFNLWGGFQAKRIDIPINCVGLETMKKFIKEVWADDNEEYYNYIISWLAGLVTNLKSINMRAIVAVSKQGCGKNTLMDFMELILRRVNTLSVMGVDRITGKFNKILQGKRLVNINEMASTKEEFRSNFETMKGYITEPTLFIEPKGVDPYTIKNISNFILFTQHRDSIIVEEYDRRYAVFEISDRYMQNDEYFTNLRNTCFNQETADAFYTYLLDFPAVNLSNIPNTLIRQEMTQTSKANTLKFIDAIYEDKIFGDEVQIQSSIMYSKYREWCSACGEKNIVSLTKFGIVASARFKKVKNNCVMYVL